MSGRSQSRSRSRSRSRSPRRASNVAAAPSATPTPLWQHRPRARVALGVFVVCVALAAGAVIVRNLTDEADARGALLVSPMVGPGGLLAYRGTCAALVVVTLATMYADRTPFVFTHRGSTVRLLGVARFSTFTPWAFTLIGVYFGITTALGLGLVAPSSSLTLAAVLLYEAAFPLSILVSAIVTWVLYPAAVRDRRRMRFVIARQFMWPALMMHVANVAMMMGETVLCHHHPWCYWYAALSVFVGSIYLAFAWLWHYHTGVFYYFFLDTSWRFAPAAYVLVTLVLLLFALLTFALRALLYYEALPSPLVYAAAAGFTWSVSRFRDSRK